MVTGGQLLTYHPGHRSYTHQQVDDGIETQLDINNIKVSTTKFTKRQRRTLVIHVKRIISVNIHVGRELTNGLVSFIVSVIFHWSNSSKGS